MTKISETDNDKLNREEASTLDTWIYQGKKLGDMTKEDLLRAAENERRLGEEAKARMASYRTAADRRENDGNA